MLIIIREAMMVFKLSSVSLVIRVAQILMTGLSVVRNFVMRLFVMSEL